MRDMIAKLEAMIRQTVLEDNISLLKELEKRSIDISEESELLKYIRARRSILEREAGRD